MSSIWIALWENVLCEDLLYIILFILKRRHQEDGLFEEFPVNHQGAILPNHNFRSVSSCISSKKEWWKDTKIQTLLDGILNYYGTDWLFHSAPSYTMPGQVEKNVNYISDS